MSWMILPKLALKSVEARDSRLAKAAAGMSLGIAIKVQIARSFQIFANTIRKQNTKLFATDLSHCSLPLPSSTILLSCLCSLDIVVKNSDSDCFFVAYQNLFL